MNGKKPDGMVMVPRGKRVFVLETEDINKKRCFEQSFKHMLKMYVGTVYSTSYC